MNIGRKVDISIKYKILPLEIAKEITNLFIPPCFQHVLFCDNFVQKQPKKNFRNEL